MGRTSPIDLIAALLADTSRATMLLTLLDGRAYTSRELAVAAEITPQTASFHLDRLERAACVASLRQGRFSYYRILDESVAAIVEQMLTVSAVKRARHLKNSCPEILRTARACYKHIAGRLGVRIHKAFVAKKWLEPSADGYRVAPAHTDCLRSLDAEIKPHGLDATPCLDWSEREYHLAGPLANCIFEGMLQKRWLIRGSGRQLIVTSEGARSLRHWGIADCG